MGGIFGVSTPGGETNAVCVSGHLETVDHIVGVLFAFQRPNHYPVPAVVGGDMRSKALKGQLSAHGFGLLGAFKGTTLNHPAAIVFLLGGRGFRRFFYAGDRRGGLGFRLRSGVMRRRLQQILVRLLVGRCLLRLLLLHRLRLLDARLLLRGLLLRLRPLLLLCLLLLLRQTLTLQRLLTLRRRLFVPRHFSQLRRLLTHIRLHLRQQLALLVGKLLGFHHFAAGGRLCRRANARLAAFQLFNIAPALFRFRRETVACRLTVLQRFRFFFLVMGNEIQTTDKGHQHGRCDRNHSR